MGDAFNSVSPRRPGELSPEFAAIFSESEMLEIARALERDREFPLKYAYKGRGAKQWDRFYLKHLWPRWYRATNPEIELLNQNLDYIKNQYAGKQITIFDVGAGNSCPVKKFVTKLNRSGAIAKYVALDISPELLQISEQNFKRWFPTIAFDSCAIDIENDSLPERFVNQSNKLILHLGVTIGNHRDRAAALKNLKKSLQNGDLLVIASEIGSNSQWNGSVRGGFKYHVDRVYAEIQNLLGLRAQDCQLQRSYDPATDSLVAQIEFLQDYQFEFGAIAKTIQIPQNKAITIWRQHLYQIPELQQEIEQAGLQFIRYQTNQSLSNILAICQVQGRL